MSARAMGWGLAAAATSLLCAVALPACQTDAYCFDCERAAVSSGSATASSAGGHAGSPLSGGEGGCLFDCQGAGGAGGSCTPTPDPTEVCDGEDNDCDGKVDNLSADAFEAPTSCGNC